MATTYYLVINGVAGNYSDKLLTGAFQVSDFDFLTTNKGTTHLGPGAGGGTSTFNPLSLTLDSNSYAALLTDLGKGSVISGVSLIGETTGAGGTPLITYDLNLSNVVVTDLLKDTSKNGGVDLTLDYSKIGLVTSTVDSAGRTTTDPLSFGWDIRANKATDSGTELTSGGTAVGATTPTKYFLLIDGFNGGSTDKGHVGWFEIDNFNIDAKHSSNIQSGTGAGSGLSDFGDLSVTLQGDLASLLADSASGAVLRGVKIEGVTASDTPVYDLEVANVLISKIDDTSTTAATIDFKYSEIGLTTKGQNASSQFVQTGTSGWDVVQNRSISAGSLPGLNTGGTFSAGGASSYYLVIHGVAGDYSDKLLTAAFKVSDFEFLTANGSQIGAAGNGAASTFDPLTLTLDSNSYAALLTDLGKGALISGVSLIGETGGVGGTSLITYDLNLSNVVVTGLSKDTSKNGGVDLTLDYSKIGLVTSTVDPSGRTTTNPQSFGWDVAENKATDTGTELTSGGTAVGATTPTKYFLLIDGFNGGSTDKGHAGWFEISNFNIDTSTTSNIQSGAGQGGSGKPTFGDLSVTLQGDLAGLLADSAPGALLRGVKIEGVTATDTPVYDLEVANVLISKIDDTSTPGYTIDFNYGQIGLTTETQNPNTGQVTQTGSSGWDVAQNRSISAGSLPGLNTGGTFSAGGASSYYLVIHGVAGDYSDKLLTGAFKVSDFEFLTANGGTTHLGPGAGAGTSTFNPLSLTLDSNGYAALLTDLGKGSVISGVSLIGEKAGVGGTPLITYDLNLSNVVVTDLAKDTSKNTGVDLTLDYNKIGLVTSTVGPSGNTTTNPQNFGWDVAANQVTTDTGTEQTSGGTAVGASTPTKYYVLIDGFNGGSTDKGHAGWFEISNFNIDTSTTSNIQSGAGHGGGKPTFGDLSITTKGDVALPSLLADSAPGALLRGVKIEGVTATDTPVYDLEVANVLISKIDDTSTPGYVINFNYSQIGLTTEGQNASSQFVQTGSSGWDVAENRSISASSLPTLHVGTNAPCYCRDTLILTDRGEVPVQALAIGDVVVTMSGATRPIKWIGRRSYAGQFAFGHPEILPVCIRAGALDDNTPRRDLWISPHHAMFLEGVLIEARDLLNGVSIVQAEDVERVEYFHIELETHDVIVAEGAFSESFIDDDIRNLFHNAPEYGELYPDEVQGPVRHCAPRLDSGYAVEKARRHIEARAGLRAAANDNADVLRGYVDEISSRRISGWAQNPDHPEAPVCLDVYANGRLIGQTLANRYREDLQQAGVGSGCHGFEFTPPAGLTFAPDAVEVRRAFDGAWLSASYSARMKLAAVKREPDRRTA